MIDSKDNEAIKIEEEMVKVTQLNEKEIMIERRAQNIAIEAAAGPKGIKDRAVSKYMVAGI